MESRRRESETTVHRVGSQLKRFLSDVELAKFGLVFFALDLILDQFSLLHQVPQNIGQYSIFMPRVGLVGQIAHLFHVCLFVIGFNISDYFLNLRAIEVLGCAPVHCCEAKVILLDDRRIKRVEIKQENNAIVEASLRLEHKTSTILGLLAFRLARFVLSASLFRFLVLAEHGRTCLLSVQLLFVRAEEFTATEFVEQKHFVTLSTGVLQRSVPEITRNCGQLLGEGDNHKMLHELEGQISISLGMIGQLENAVSAAVESGEHVIVEIFA